MEKIIIEEEKQYWLDKFKEELPDINLSFKTNEDLNEFKYKQIILEEDLGQKLAKACKNELSKYVYILTIFKISIFKYFDYNDVIISSPILKSNHNFFNKWIYFRDNLKWNISFTDYLKEIGQTTVNGYKFQNYPLRNFISELKINKEIEKNLFCVISDNLHSQEYIDEFFDKELNESALILLLDNSKEIANIQLKYNPKFFNEEDLDDFQRIFQQIVKQTLNDPAIKIYDIEVITAEDKKLIRTFNTTSSEFLSEKTIHGLFYDRIEKFNKHVAINSVIDASDIYNNEYNNSIIEEITFRKNPYLFQSSLIDNQYNYYLLKNQFHKVIICNENLIKLLTLFDGKTNLRSIYEGIKTQKCNINFFILSREDILEINKKVELRVQYDTINDLNELNNITRILQENDVLHIESLNTNLKEIVIAANYFNLTDCKIEFDDILFSKIQRKQADVLLLGDTTGMASVGILYLASYLQRNGITSQCQMFDNNDDAEKLKEYLFKLLKEVNPKVVGVSMKWFLHISRVINICEIVKKYSSEIKVVVGGNTASIYKDEIIKNDCIDYVIKGDGELPLLKICKNEQDIPNCIYKSGNVIIDNLITYKETNENAHEVYLSNIEQVLPTKNECLFGSFFIYTHRGCGYNCFYCGGANDVNKIAFGRNGLYIREVELVRKDIITLLPYVSNLKFVFDIGNKNLLDYCKSIWSNIDLSSHYCTITNIIPPTKEVIEYATSIFKYVYWNIDLASLSERHRKELVDLKILKQQPTDNQIITFFEECEKHENCEVILNLISGLPKFTKEDITLSDNLLKQISENYKSFSEFFWGRLHAQPGAPIIKNAGDYQMKSLATCYADFLEYSRKNFEQEKYPGIDYSNYPYIYYSDDKLNSEISKFYIDTNKKISNNKIQRKLDRKIIKEITYQDLNAKSNQIARFLIERGIEENQVVGIIMDRSENFIISMLSVLKAGGAYVPIDPDLPEARISFIMSNSGIQLCLTTRELLDKKNEIFYGVSEENILCIDKPQLFSNYCKDNLDDINTAQNLMYVIYTSGSTGKPKGVSINHGGFINLVNFHQSIFKEDINTKMSQVANLSFDAMSFEVWPCLLSGATLFIADNETRMNPTKMKEWLISNKINITFQPTAIGEMLLNEDWTGNNIELRHLRVAGDILKKIPSKKFPFKIYNLYGPTEDTVWTTWKEIDINADNEIITIGKPIANHHIYILGNDNSLKGINKQGEICLSGIGLTKGYIKLPKLNKEKLISNPYIENALLYKTGDLGRWLPNGEIEFIGRKDEQVKIRGYRIELSEINNQFLKHPDIKNVISIVKENDNKEKQIITYYTGNIELLRSDIDNHLLKVLPGYMLPTICVYLKEFPLTLNGKINRNDLPNPYLVNNIKIVVPKTYLESSMAELWAQVLECNISEIGVNSNFFELGGHSLKATILIEKIHKKYNVRIPLIDFFDNPTIVHVLNYINVLPEEKFKSITRSEEKPFYQLSSAQMRMYIIQKLSPDNLAYNLFNILQLNGKLDVDKLKSCFEQLIKRHDSLRTSIINIDNEPVQKISTHVEFNMIYEDNFLMGDIDKKVKLFVRPFDLSISPLFRMQLHKVNPETHILMIDMHHIICDGISHALFIRDFMSFYNNTSLPELNIQYKDYSEWMHSPEQKIAIEKQKAFWMNEFSEEYTPLDLPIDYPRTAIKSSEGSTVEFVLDQDALTRLYQIANSENSSLFIVILSILNIYLSKLCNQEDITIGTPIAGRRHPDLENIIGMFVNTLVLRNRVNNELTFKDFLSHVKSKTIAVFENQDYQFEELIDELNLVRDTSRSALLDVVFSMQNMPSNELDIPGLSIKPLDIESNISKYDFSLTAIELENKLHLMFRYAEALFKEETIKRFIKYFENIVSTIIENPNQKVHEIDIMPAKEKEQIQHVFNNTYADYQKDRSIYELFAEQVKRTPDKNALVFEGKTLTYADLSTRVNQLANIIKNKNIPDIVGILVDPSFEMIISMIAIIKAGAAFLPIDPHQSRNRINSIIKDSKISLLLTQTWFENEFDFDGAFIHLNKPLLGDKQPELDITHNEMLCVIYTSGSTGHPKGAMITHQNMLNNNNWFTRTINVCSEDKAILTTSYAFDAIYTLVFGTLLKGAELHIVPKETYLTTVKLINYIEEFGITLLKMTPSLFNLIVNESYFKEKNWGKVRFIMIGGEFIRPADVKKYLGIFNHTKILNHYGPTETTIGAVAKFINISDCESYNAASVIGKPIDNVKIYIADKYGKIVPIGVTGELFIAGDGVSNGYVNQEVLAEQRFLKSKFVKDEIVYKTGDIGKWLSDGNIELTGRIDDQVKIRGNRIELGEIEHQLMLHVSVKTSVVTAYEINNEKYIVAYYIPELDIDTKDLREYLIGRLPDYMIPSFFVPMDSFPKLANGKVNKKLLPAPETGYSGVIIAPETELEEWLLNIWSELLNIDKSKISTTSSFFELGGNSVSAVKLNNRILEELNYDMSLIIIFRTPTIREIAQHIKVFSNLSNEFKAGNDSLEMTF